MKTICGQRVNKKKQFSDFSISCFSLVGNRMHRSPNTQMHSPFSSNDFAKLRRLVAITVRGIRWRWQMAQNINQILCMEPMVHIVLQSNGQFSFFLMDNGNIPHTTRRHCTNLAVAIQCILQCLRKARRRSLK